jgi:hypothetical protein
MNPIVLEVFDDLARRARQRGFVMMAEVQQELEDAAAPADAFDQVVEALREVEIEVREDSPEMIYGGFTGMDEIEVSDPVRMYLQEIGRVALLDAQQEVELSMQMETGRRAIEKLRSGEVAGVEETAILQRSRRPSSGWSKPTCAWWCPSPRSTWGGACLCSTWCRKATWASCAPSRSSTTARVSSSPPTPRGGSARR